MSEISPLQFFKPIPVYFSNPKFVQTSWLDIPLYQTYPNKWFSNLMKYPHC